MRTKNTYGILGGLGPLASAQFLLSLYKNVDPVENEQEMPKVVMISDPTFPDRTTYFLKGFYDEIGSRTESAIRTLLQLGASHIILCCITLHAIVPFLPRKLRRRLISLPEAALQEVIRIKQRALLMSTNGTRGLRIFENSPAWKEASSFVTLPDETDQQEIHKLIYAMKTHFDPTKTQLFLAYLCKKYQVGHLICGCTEFHLVSTQLKDLDSGPNAIKFIDPLNLVMKQVK